MKLSAKAEYACLAMVELANQFQRDVPITIKSIADAYGISQAFLMQIFLQLKGARLVQSVRGASGGYRLARAPEKIRVLDVVSAIDGPAKEASALSALAAAPAVQLLQRVWADVRAAQTHVLSNVTLADVIQQMRTGTGVDFQI